MKKTLIFAVLLLAGTSFFACNTKVEDHYNNYNMNLLYTEDSHTLSGSMQIDYYNSSDTALSNVMFHLYANAFDDNNTQTVSPLNYEIAYYNGDSFGNTEISSVSSNNTKCNYEITGEDSNVLKVELLQELAPEEYVSIDIEFKTMLANVNHRLGYGENTTNIFNFYPIACVFENNNFVTDLYHYNGDPFYSDISNYNVTISYADKFVLASTGDMLSSVCKDNIVTDTISASKVRDFGFALSEFFAQTETCIDDTNLQYFYYNDTKVEETIKVIADCFKFFSENYGEYPYKSLSVVQANFVHGGMEYPNIVLISDAEMDYQTYLSVVVHEMAHQWWYGVVGNNQFKEGYIDEGLTEFSTLLYFDSCKGYNKKLEDSISAATKNYTSFYNVYTDVLGEIDTSMNRALDEFDTEPEYVYSSYVKSVLMFSTIYDFLGHKNFMKAMNYLYQNYMYKNITEQDLKNAFCISTKKNLNNIFQSYISGETIII